MKHSRIIVISANGEETQHEPFLSKKNKDSTSRLSYTFSYRELGLLENAL